MVYHKTLRAFTLCAIMDEMPCVCETQIVYFGAFSSSLVPFPSNALLFALSANLFVRGILMAEDGLCTPMLQRVLDKELVAV